MRKQFLLIGVLFAMILSAPAAFARDIRVTVNGAEVPLGNAAVLRDGAAVLPMDDIFYALDQRVPYHSKEGTATVAKDGGNTVCFKEDSSSVTVNGATKSLSAPAVKQDGVLYIPADGVTAVIGGTAQWDGETVEIEEEGYQFGLDAVHLYRPEERDSTSGVILEEYSIDIPIDPDVFEYTQVVTEDRIPVVSVLEKYYGIDYKITQAYKRRPTATITLSRDGTEYVYKINFLEQ